jgi:uncharacterized protein YdaU (DUF1376 family)
MNSGEGDKMALSSQVLGSGAPDASVSDSMSEAAENSAAPTWRVQQMPAKRLPYFPFYPNDWLASATVQVMTAAQRGAFIQLLAHAWNQPGCLLRDDDAHLSALSGLGDEWATTGRFVREQFESVDGGLRNCKQWQVFSEWRKFSRGKSKAGKASAAQRQQKGNTQPTAPQQPTNITPTEGQPSLSSSSSLSSSLSPSRKREPDGRSKWPIYKGSKLIVFDWQLDDHGRILGDFTNDFDLHRWYDALDKQCAKANMVPPDRDGGAWLKVELLKEIRQRGLPITVAGASSSGKLTDADVAEILADVHASEARAKEFRR